jgi:microcystin-dependent protein
LRGKTVFMSSSTQTGFTTYGYTSGSSTHVQTEAELASHRHLERGMLTGTGGSSQPVYITTRNSMTDADSGSYTAYTGSSEAMNIMNPYLVMNYIIKY